MRQGLEESIRDEVEVYRVELEAVKAELTPWEKQMREVQSRIDVAASERELLIKQQKDAEQRLADNQSTLNAAHETARKKAQQINEMEAAVLKHRCVARCACGRLLCGKKASTGPGTASRNCCSDRHQTEQARQEEAAAAQRVIQLEGHLREARGRLEQRRTDISSQASQSAVVMALLEARQRDEIKGIHGRLGEGCRKVWDHAVAAACHYMLASLSALRDPLPPHCLCHKGDLGAIGKEYDVAVSTSCPALDYIVVETTNAAQRCVELLRQRQLGVATFLILEKQQHLVAAIKEKKKPPEGKPSRAQALPTRNHASYSTHDSFICPWLLPPLCQQVSNVCLTL